MQEDKLYFYSGSSDVFPGKGKNEHVVDQSMYIKLSKIKDWRKILSNFHVSPFTYNKHIYNTIEHAFQAQKIALVDADIALKFALDVYPRGEIAAGDGIVARKCRKIVILPEDTLLQWDNISHDIMKEIAIEKYKSCEIARNVLKCTHRAQLWHLVARSKTHIRIVYLESIRDQL
jgi:predicted NAD-dependent protein-ADP-ribosyltransferase YbiA (DUF1768 family)